MNAAAYDPAWAFLKNAGSFPDLESLQDAFGRAVGAFGFNQFSCSLVIEAGKAPAPKALFGRSNKVWDDHYLEQGYLGVDPCARLAARVVLVVSRSAHRVSHGFAARAVASRKK